MSIESVTPFRGSSLPKRVLHGLIARFDRWYFNRFQLRDRSIDGRLDALLRAAARQYARYELPGHIQILEALLVQRPFLWKDAGFATCKGCWHGYTLRLDLRDYYQRWAYFLGRYHEVPLQLLLRHTLRPGDTLIDGGANTGLVSLVGAWLVGPRGRVIAFEPNQAAFERLEWHLTTNGLKQVIPIRAGLSDEAAELTLQVPGEDNLGAGTFAEIPGRYRGRVSAQCSAPVLPGDQCAEVADTGGELVIKLDVEGFECRALRGLKNTIAKRRPLILAEANQEMLTHAGSSIQEMRELMESQGYRGHAMETARLVVRHRRLVLTPIVDWSHPPADVAWILPGSSHADRLTACVRP